MSATQAPEPYRLTRRIGPFLPAGTKGVVEKVDDPEYKPWEYRFFPRAAADAPDSVKAASEYGVLVTRSEIEGI